MLFFKLQGGLLALLKFISKQLARPGVLRFSALNYFTSVDTFSAVSELTTLYVEASGM